MTTEDIIKLCKDPGLADHSTQAGLSMLLEEYPYFQTAHLLHLINLQNIRDLRFAAELRIMACYAGDRTKLFFLVEQEKFAALDVGKLDMKKDSTVSEDSFSLIDFFLSGKDNDAQNEVRIQKLPKETLVSSDYFYALSVEADDGMADVAPMKHQDVIDSFLEKDGKSSIKFELNRDDSGSDQISAPVNDGPEENTFFSETLAKIYLRQKKYDKALAIIKKLNLLYPEKNIYFADQIRFLEKLITNTKKI